MFSGARRNLRFLMPVDSISSRLVRGECDARRQHQLAAGPGALDLGAILMPVDSIRSPWGERLAPGDA